MALPMNYEKKLLLAAESIAKSLEIIAKEMQKNNKKTVDQLDMMLAEKIAQQEERIGPPWRVPGE